MAGMPGVPMQNGPMLAMPNGPGLAMPMAPAPQFAQQLQPPRPPMNQWQPMPAAPQQPFSMAQMASGAVPAQQPPIKARGVSADPTPAPMATKFVLPSPEELGVHAKPRLPMPTASMAAPATIDWNQVHARMDRLGVLKHERNRLPTGGVRVMLLLPTADPALGQPVEAIAETEANAVALALDRAEAWMARR